MIVSRPGWFRGLALGLAGLAAMRVISLAQNLAISPDDIAVQQLGSESLIVLQPQGEPVRRLGVLNQRIARCYGMEPRRLGNSAAIRSAPRSCATATPIRCSRGCGAAPWRRWYWPWTCCGCACSSASIGGSRL